MARRAGEGRSLAGALLVKAVVRGKRKKKVFDAVTLAPLPPGLA